MLKGILIWTNVEWLTAQNYLQYGSHRLWRHSSLRHLIDRALLRERSELVFKNAREHTQTAAEVRIPTSPTEVYDVTSMQPIAPVLSLRSAW